MRGQFRDFEDREDLAFFDAITDININLADVAGDFGVHVYVLERLKRSCQVKRVAEIAALYARHRHRDFRWRIGSGAVHPAPCDETDDSQDRYRQKEFFLRHYIYLAFKCAPGFKARLLGNGRRRQKEPAFSSSQGTRSV